MQQMVGTHQTSIYKWLIGVPGVSYTKPSKYLLRFGILGMFFGGPNTYSQCVWKRGGYVKILYAPNGVRPINSLKMEVDEGESVEKGPFIKKRRKKTCPLV